MYIYIVFLFIVFSVYLLIKPNQIGLKSKNYTSIQRDIIKINADLTIDPDTILHMQDSIC